MDEREKLAKLQRFWQTARNSWAEWQNRAKYAYDFYLGKQWDAEVVEVLKRENRPYLTLNKIKPIIRTLSGWQRQNRQDLQVLPRRGGIGPLAEIFTELLKYFYDVAHADWETSLIFLDGIITGKGWVALDIDYTKEPLNGELVLRRERPTMVYEDPNAQRYDLSDAQFIIRTYWAEKEKILQEFPEAEEKIGLLSTVDALEREPIIGVETTDYQTYAPLEQAITDLDKYRYLIKEFYWREFEKRKFIIDMRTLEVKDEEQFKKEFGISLNDKKAQALVNAAPDRLRVVERVFPVLNLTTVVGNIILQDKKDPFGGINAYPLIRFCADWTDGYVKGEIDDLIDPQKELNKRRSQALHLLNTEAHSGYIQDEDALTPEEEAKVDRLGSTPGIRIKVKRGSRFERIQPGALSQGHIELEKLSEDDLKKISGVNTDLLGYVPERQESGRAMLIRRQQGLLTTEIIYDNFDFTQQILGETILEFIRKSDVLSEEEIKAIVEERNLNVDIGYLKSRKVGQYQVTLTTKRETPSQRMANFYAMLDALKLGIPIPPDLIIESSDLPNKEKILEAIKQKTAPAGPVSKGSVGPIPEPEVEEIPGEEPV